MKARFSRPRSSYPNARPPRNCSWLPPLKQLLVGAGMAQLDFVPEDPDAFTKAAGDLDLVPLCPSSWQFSGGRLPVVKAKRRADAAWSRYGAVGQKGTIAVVERFFLTFKNEFTRRILVPILVTVFRREVQYFMLHGVVQQAASALGASRYDARREVCRTPR